MRVTRPEVSRGAVKGVYRGHVISNLRRARSTASLNAWAQSGSQPAGSTPRTSQLARGSRVSWIVKSGAKPAQPSRIAESLIIIAWTSASVRFCFLGMPSGLPRYSPTSPVVLRCDDEVKSHDMTRRDR